MVQDTLAFKCALITGGGGGLGFAMAEFFLSEGKQVIIAGRTEDKLVAASKKLKDAPYYVLDTGSIADIKPFVEKIVKEHPEVRQACGARRGRCAHTSHSSTASSTTQACSARSTSTTLTLMRRTRS